MSRIVRLDDEAPLRVDPGEAPVFVCRCGLSRRWPYCDGSHKAARGEGEGLFVYRRDEEGRPVRHALDVPPEPAPE